MSTERDVTREVQLLDAIDLQLITQKGIEDAEQQEQLVAIARYALTLTEELEKLIEAEEASYDAPAVSREFLAAVKALLSSPAGRHSEEAQLILPRRSAPKPAATPPGNLYVECFICGEALYEAGALLFDPPIAQPQPDGSTIHTTVKRHICARCFPAADTQLRRLVYA